MNRQTRALVIMLIALKAPSSINNQALKLLILKIYDMSSAIVSLLNALILIILGLFGYFVSDNPSVTALIPVFVGIVLLLLNRGIWLGKKRVIKAATVLTFILIIGLIKPLLGTISRSDSEGIMRVLVMMFMSLISLGFFIITPIYRKYMDADE